MKQDKMYSRLNNVKDESKKIKDVQDRMAKVQNEAVRHIAAIPEGQIFLNILMRECGYNQPNIVRSEATGLIDVNATLVNEAIRGLYVRMRRLIPPVYLKEIEFMDLRAKALEIVVEQENEGETT